MAKVPDRLDSTNQSMFYLGKVTPRADVSLSLTVTRRQTSGVKALSVLLQLSPQESPNDNRKPQNNPICPPAL